MDHFASLHCNIVCKSLLSVFKNNVNFFLMFICQSFLSSLHVRTWIIFCEKSSKVCAKPANIPLKAY